MFTFYLAEDGPYIPLEQVLCNLVGLKFSRTIHDINMC